MKKILTNQKGTAILIALSLIAMLVAVGIMSVDRSTTDIELSFNQLHEDQSFYGAEAGIARAMVLINSDTTWRGPILKEKLGNAEYTVIVLDSLWDPALFDTLIIRSTSMTSGSASNLEAWVIPRRFSPFNFGVFAGASLSMMKNTCSDSYDSDIGPYDSSVILDGGNIGSNGTVTIQDGSVIYGDVTTATPGGLTIDPGATVMGDTSSTVDSVEFETIPDSEYAWAKSVNNATTGLSGSGFTYDATTNALTVSQDGNVVLQDGIYYFSDLTLENKTALTIAPGANVIIYVTGDIRMGKESSMNYGGAPSDMIIYSTGHIFSIHKQAEFYGAFYGPNTSFALDTNNIDLTWIGKKSNIYGSIIGSTIRVNKETCFHYDQALSRMSMGRIREMELVAWRQM